MQETELEALPRFYSEETDSTNEDAKRYFQSGKGSTALFVANRQTAGKGRRGRQFYSPADTGIYMSILLAAPEDLEDAVCITTATSVFVAEAVEAVTGLSLSIKWVNDLFYNDRKVCGILTEAVWGTEEGAPAGIVVGIGINLCTEEFPEELADIAGGLNVREKGIKERIIDEIVRRILRFNGNRTDRTYLEEYRRRSNVIGKDIYVYEGQTVRQAKAVGIDEEGGLVIEEPDGSVGILRSGEITIRPV